MSAFSRVLPSIPFLSYEWVIFITRGLEISVTHIGKNADNATADRGKAICHVGDFAKKGHCAVDSYSTMSLSAPSLACVPFEGRVSRHQEVQSRRGNECRNQPDQIVVHVPATRMYMHASTVSTRMYMHLIVCSCNGASRQPATNCVARIPGSFLFKGLCKKENPIKSNDHSTQDIAGWWCSLPSPLTQGDSPAINT